MGIVGHGRLPPAKLAALDETQSRAAAPVFATSRGRLFPPMLPILPSCFEEPTTGVPFSMALAVSIFTDTTASPLATSTTMALTTSTSASPLVCPTGSFATAATALSRTSRKPRVSASSKILPVRSLPTSTMTAVRT